MESQQQPGSAPAPTITGTSSATPTLPPTIVYDDFAKLALRAATIVQAESIEKSKKLLRLQIDLGNDERRQILAGIKEHYSPESLVGRQIVVIANLAPREVIKGETSYGMLLAAHDAATGRVVLVAPSDGVAPGSKVS